MRVNQDAPWRPPSRGKIVLDLEDRRDVWTMPAWVPARLRAMLPDGWTLHHIETASEGTGDGAARVHPEVLAALEGAQVYLGYGIPAEILARGADLRWVHSGSAGVVGSLTPEMRASRVLFTNSSGVHGAPMAETVLAMILHFGRGLDVAVKAQRARRWSAEDIYRGEGALRELSASTVGIVGFGGVGREVARRVAALGARVLALRRAAGGNGSETETLGSRVPVGDGVEVLSGAEGLSRLLDESDYLVLTAPDTAETRGLINAAALAQMQASAVLVNVARGRLVDEDALVTALRRGRLRGAALDVFHTEPLPPEHPFWSLPNVLITPHVSAVTQAFWERETGLIVENLRRFFKGKPLVNLVDKEAGY